MDEGKKAFLAESSELLEDMESALLLVEASEGRDKEALNSVFRAIHTIKGSAGVVGIDNVEKFAHKVESALDLMRQGELRPTPESIGLMLECRDHISTLISVAVGQQKEMAYTIAEQVRLIEALEALMGEKGGPEEEIIEETVEEDEGTGFRVASDNWHISLRFSPDVLRNGMDPLSFISYLGGIGNIVHIHTMLDALPSLADMDPESCYLGFEIDIETKADKAAIEDVFEFVREDCIIHILPPKSRISKYVNLIGSLPEDRYRLGEILMQGGAVTERELAHALEIQKAGSDKNIGDILVDEGIIHKPVLDAAVQKQQGQPVGSKAVEASSIRVDTEKLDALVNIVGEMVITGASVQQEAAQIKNARLLQAVSSMARLIESLRDSAMRVRMMPLHDTFGRFHRTVRDICHESGKDIALEIEGGETELDRTLIEKIKDPLMHLVRNAADHGIEPQQERASAGKPQRGTITLRAYQETGDIIIEVQDDGKGLSKRKIEQKALERGLIERERAAELSEAEILHLIFMPGFSTAEEVTNISGRGVGMDVVRRNIEALHGSVDIQSAEGAGTTVKVRLPLTLAIIDGFLVSVGETSFVVPMDMVVECIELSEQARRDSHGRDHVNLRGSVLPYISLRDMFSASGARSSLEHVLVVRHSGMKTGLLVDRLHGEVQAVVKSLGKVYKGAKGISGATIMGDGTVALILDVPALVKKALKMQAR